MTAFCSMLGDRSGSLVVIDESDHGHPRKIIAKCDCGRAESLNAQRFREGKYVACGVCKPRIDPTLISLIGQTFGKLTVIDEPLKSGRRRKVLCRCECGTTKLVTVQSLRAGRSTTCGSCNRSNDRLKSVLGNKYGMLTVIAEPEICRNRRVLCKCECGNTVLRYLANLKRGQTKSCGCAKEYNHETGYVYYLLDPTTKEIRYVGQSVQQPGVRLSSHLYGVKRRMRSVDCTEKKAWFASLKPLRPLVVVAENGIPVAELTLREQQYIACKLANGANLLNIHYAGGAA